MPSNERINYLFRRFFDKTYTAEEREELIDYINQSEFDSALKTLIEENWNRDIPEYEQDERKVDEIFHHILGQEKRETPVVPIFRNRKRVIRYAMGIAASVMIAFSAWHFWPAANGEPSAGSAGQIVYRCKAGEREAFILPDGTTVKLNSNSTLTMMNDFSGSKRTVSLEGEGFFDVAHNPEKPFTILTNEMTIKVLGTSFNVKAYSEDDVFETSVIRGSVEVTLSKNRQQVVLHPNEKISLANEQHAAVPVQQTAPGKPNPASARIAATVQPVTRNRDSSIVEISWTENKLAFAGESFPEIAKKIERWYNIRVLYENDEVLDKLREERLTATFSNEKPELVMEALRLVSKKFHYRIDKEGNVVIGN